MKKPYPLLSTSGMPPSEADAFCAALRAFGIPAETVDLPECSKAWRHVSTPASSHARATAFLAGWIAQKRAS